MSNLNNRRKDIVYGKMLKTDIRDIVDANLELRSIQYFVRQSYKGVIINFEDLMKKHFRATFNEWDMPSQDNFCKQLAGLRFFELKNLLIFGE